MADGGVEAPTPFLLSDREKQVLELYDKLQQLQLEIALLNAQKKYVPGKPPRTPGSLVHRRGFTNHGYRYDVRAHHRTGAKGAPGFACQIHIAK